MTKLLWQWSASVCLLTAIAGCVPPESKPRGTSAKTSSPATKTSEPEKATEPATPAEAEKKTEETSSTDSPKKDPEQVAKVENKPDEEKKPAKDEPYKFADLIKPFTPPTLAELDEKAEWVDRPVVDSLKLLRDQQATVKPLVSVAEALKLKNNTPKENEQILSALGRLPVSDAEVNWDAAINRHAYGDVNSTNPILNSSVVESDINTLIGFGLFSFDGAFNPFAASDTVVSWQTSKDRMLDKVVMRKDLTWSDGKPITAHDVVFSFQTIMTSAVPVPAVRSGTDKLKWIEAYDDHTLVYFQKENYATNVWNLNFPVIPKHIYESTIEKDPTLVNTPEHVKLENDPVTGGPYIIKSRLRRQEIVLTARESWYMHDGKQVRDKPYFSTIRFRIRPDASVALLALKSGDIDEMQLSPEQWRTQTNDDAYYKNNTKAYGLEWTEFHFLWNCQDPLFNDPNVRKAMSYAVDYEELIERLRYGLDEQCNGVFHPTSKWATKPALPLYKQDLDKAEELLDAAGWTDSDGDGIRDKEIDGKLVKFEFTILTVNKSDRISICTLLKESLDQIQIKCNVKALEFPVVIEKMQKHDFQAAFGGWGTGTDPYSLENIFKTNEERNYGNYSNKEIDKLFEAGMREFDETKRAAIYGKIQKILYEDQPYTWLFYQNGYYGFNNTLRGYNFSPRGPFHYGPGFGSIWKPASL